MADKIMVVYINNERKGIIEVNENAPENTIRTRGSELCGCDKDDPAIITETMIHYHPSGKLMGL